MCHEASRELARRETEGKSVIREELEVAMRRSAVLFRSI
jgi:hypothetical protein